MLSILIQKASLQLFLSPVAHMERDVDPGQWGLFQSGSWFTKHSGFRIRFLWQNQLPWWEVNTGQWAGLTQEPAQVPVTGMSGSGPILTAWAGRCPPVFCLLKTANKISFSWYPEAYKNMSRFIFIFIYASDIFSE